MFGVCGSCFWGFGFCFICVCVCIFLFFFCVEFLLLDLGFWIRFLSGWGDEGGFFKVIYLLVDDCEFRVDVF